MVKKLAIIFQLVFLSLLINVNADVDSFVLTLNNQDYDYAVINREYDLFVAGSNLTIINNPELSLVLFNDEVIQYKFKPQSNAGLRDFGEFKVNVLSEADELANSIGGVELQVNDKNSTFIIDNLDLGNKAIKWFDFNVDEFSGRVDLDNLLDGFTFDLSFKEDEKYPEYNKLSINSSTSNLVVGSVLSFNRLSFTVDDVNDNPQLLNQVIDKYNANVEYLFNAKAVKEGNDFLFWSDEGYSNLGNSDLENLQNLINERIKLINPDEIVNFLIPIDDFSEFTKFVDFNISVDFGDLKLEDGTYNLKIKYEDKYGNKGEKPFTVKLDVTNEGSPETPVNGKLEFKNPIINQTLEKIENLPDNVNLTAVIFGNVKPDKFAVVIPQVKTALKFMQINISKENVTGSFDLFFKIDKNSINADDKSNVRLYVEENNTWTELSTLFVEETSTQYKYKSVLPHFSNFMMAVKEVPVSATSSNSGSGNGKNRNDDNDEPIILPPSPLPTEPQQNPEVIIPPQEQLVQEEEPQGLFAITTAAIANFVKQNPLASVFFALVGMLGGLIVYNMLFRRPKNLNEAKVEEKIENLEKEDEGNEKI